MMKKCFALLLSGALVLSANMVASAATVGSPDTETGAYSAKVEGTTDVQVPTIDITVPDSLEVAINPYKMEYTFTDNSKATDVLANVEQTITNASDVPIAISATVQATVTSPSEVVLVTAPLKGTETTKSVFAYLEMSDTSGTYAEAYDKVSTKQVVLGKTAVTKKDMIKLDAKDGATTDAYFKIMGDVAPNPAKAWTTDDTMGIAITFNFNPVAATTE